MIETDVVRVDYARRRAWLTSDAYDELLSHSTKELPSAPLFGGAISSFNSVTLHKAEPEQLPDVEGTVVESDVTGLLSFVEWIANGEPMKNPMAPPPNGTGEAIRGRQ